jgi:3-hydroxyacyl-[acyl-carrier-protein] dehydratase
MRFRQIDKILELVPGQKIRAERQLTGQEDYLRDHFPLFPVMPGVLMLEAGFQTASWLVRATDEYTHPACILLEIRNARFADFVQPGQTLEVTAEIQKVDGDVYTVKVSGEKGGSTAFSAKLSIQVRTLQEIDERLADVNEFTRFKVQEQLARLTA